VARQRGEQSDAGGFLDLLGDFVVYSLIPVCVAAGGWQLRQQQGGGDSSEWAPAAAAGDLVAVALLEASFHINNFVLFYAAAVIEKRRAAGLGSAELTSVAMRPALVEGMESGIMFTLMLLLPDHIRMLSYVMLAGVTVGVVQRVVWLLLALETGRSNNGGGGHGLGRENGSVRDEAPSKQD
jgi:phosphatidylglycerophosphate synthase